MRVIVIKLDPGGIIVITLDPGGDYCHYIGSWWGLLSLHWILVRVIVITLYPGGDYCHYIGSWCLSFIL